MKLSERQEAILRETSRSPGEILSTRQPAGDDVLALAKMGLLSHVISARITKAGGSSTVSRWRLTESGAAYVRRSS